MEGPTPVSALIHAATMVAAGVYLVGRCYPVFTPEVLMVIAYTGCITLFIAATIAITATDIKRVLAYSTVSQLGYMMLALGVGGWLAGLFHLFTHACFKALLFLCSGSVIHACGTNEMPQMGGLRKKMPWTAGTMLIGCLAISGAGVPLLVGFSGYYSKDRILAQALSFGHANPLHGWIFWVAVVGAAMTAFYMFRLWYLTFAGQPRDEHVYHHAHESPWTMVGPLVVLAVLAVFAGGNLLATNLGLEPLLEQARPAGIADGASAGWQSPPVVHPAEHLSHEALIEIPASLLAFVFALGGFLLATAIYGLQAVHADRLRRRFRLIYSFLIHKWWFDELYAAAAGAADAGAFAGRGGVGQQGDRLAGRRRRPARGGGRHLGRLDRPPLRRRPGQPDRPRDLCRRRAAPRRADRQRAAVRHAPCLGHGGAVRTGQLLVELTGSMQNGKCKVQNAKRGRLSRSFLLRSRTLHFTFCILQFALDEYCASCAETSV